MVEGVCGYRFPLNHHYQAVLESWLTGCFWVDRVNTGGLLCPKIGKDVNICRKAGEIKSYLDETQAPQPRSVSAQQAEIAALAA